MNSDVLMFLSVFLAFGAGFLIPYDANRRLRGRLHMAERGECDSHRKAAVLRVKLAELQRKLHQAEHELATRQTASEDQARLGALLHELAAILGVPEEPWGGIAEIEILAAAKTAARRAAEVAP